MPLEPVSSVPQTFPDNAADSVLQRIGVALVLCDDTLPSPTGLRKWSAAIGLFIATDSVHVADQATTNGKVVAPVHSFHFASD